MTNQRLDEIRDQIVSSMNMNSDEIWWKILDDTNPAHYGVEDISFYVDINDVWVNVPERTFTFKEGSLSFYARLGASKGDHSADMKFTLLLSGEGEFEFKNGEAAATNFRVNGNFDLFSGD